MCFTQEMSFAFATMGALVAVWAWSQTRNVSLVAGVVYFVLMETLQGFQYFYIADSLEDTRCKDPTNQALTFVGLVHIAFQPYFANLMASAFMRNPQKVFAYKVVKRMCLIQAAFMILRFVPGMAPGYKGMTPGAMADIPAAQLEKLKTTADWLDGPLLCTYHGERHLAWSLPAAEPTYFLPSNGLHFFMMFVPFFVVDTANIIPGLVLFLFGPVLAYSLTANLHEQASIWCFASMAQVTCLVIIFRFNMGKAGRWHYRDTMAADSKKSSDN